MIANISQIMLEDKTLFLHCINSVFEYLEIWEDSLQLEFAKAITNCFSEYHEKSNFVIYENSIQSINIILKYFMKIISTNDANISESYLLAFSSIIHFMTKNNFKIKVENDLIEYANNLGSFGKPFISRRFSVYFCSCLTQVS
jgi:hypothetical protein